MIEEIPQSSFANLELIPQAILDAPLSFFAKRWNIKFTQGTDELDSFQGAALRLDGIPFALRHYRGYPEDTTTLYLPREVSDLSKITAVIAAIVDALELSASAIRWQRADDPNL